MAQGYVVSGTQHKTGSGPALLLGMVVLIWAGMVIGVSGLATPVKFQADLLTLPVALDVGQVTFALFNRIEWGLSLLAVLVLVLFPRAVPRVTAWLVALVVAVVVAQTLWLIPALGARVAAVIAGTPMPPSPIHAVYVGAEAIKIAALGVCGWLALRWR